MDLKTLTNMFPSHKLVMGEQFAQENVSALKVKSVLRWSDTIFVNCDFSEAHFHLLMLSGAIFFKCDFAGAKFTACDIDGTEFISCNMTCADFEGSCVQDSTFSECIIGGIVGPRDFDSCTFVAPRYSRHIGITSSVPYYSISTPTRPLQIFCTPNAWRVHGVGVRLTVTPQDLPGTEEPYRSAVTCVHHMEQSVGSAAVRQALIGSKTKQESSEDI